MKKIFFLLPMLLCVMIAKSQPIVYIDFLSHNEETTTWNGTPYYTANRAKLITLTNYFQSKGISWNMQSDWRYLSNVISQETAPLMASTNGKNILRWMYEDKGVEMDPHAHETIYIYPDVVKLMDSIGLPESKLMGGSIYNDSNGINIWTNMINGQNGQVFPSRFWQPDYMMGGGTPNHVADLDYFGFWNPQDTAHFLTHTPSNHLRQMGVGCEVKLKSTDTVSVVLAKLKDVIQKVQSGDYPASGFYVQTIFFEQGDLNNAAFYNNLIELADSANALVATGHAQWKTLKQSYTLWETVYAAQMFQWECGQVQAPSGGEVFSANPFKVYPNPASGKIHVELDQEDSEKWILCEVYDVIGNLILQKVLFEMVNEIDVRTWSSGMYFYRLQNHAGASVTGKLLVHNF